MNWRKKKRSNRISVERELLMSEAFRTLPASARNIYWDFRLKCQMSPPSDPKHKRAEWQIVNNGRIEYTYAEACDKGIPPSTFQRGIEHLIKRGFIDVASVGGGAEKAKTLYAISHRWRRWGQPDFQAKVRPKKTRWANSDRIGFQKGNKHGTKGHAVRWKRESSVAISGSTPIATNGSTDMENQVRLPRNGNTR